MSILSYLLAIEAVELKRAVHKGLKIRKGSSINILLYNTPHQENLIILIKTLQFGKRKMLMDLGGKGMERGILHTLKY